MFVRRMWRDVREFIYLPRVSIDLLSAELERNDPFFQRMVGDFYKDVNRHRVRRLFLREMVHGVALSQLPATFDEYYMRIDGSARRNHKKAIREGCEVRRIVFNDHLDAVAEVRASSDVRQGRPMPESYRLGLVHRIPDPPSLTPIHDYPYFGVFQQNKMIGYGCCLVAGEYAGVDQIFGHADYLPLGPVPLFLIELARYLYANHPRVKYYAYGTYFGATETLRRFKRKFDFHPHRVNWVWSGSSSAPTTTPSEPIREGG